MTENKWFWYANMGGALAIWGFIFWGAFSPDLTGASNVFWWILTPLFVLLHPLELPISLPIAKAHGTPPGKAVVMTLVFGFVWWLPLKRNVFHK